MNQQNLNLEPLHHHPIKLSTEDIPAPHRQEWLSEVIGREYANVRIAPPKHGALFNEMTIYPWQNLRLSVIHSSSINIERLPKEPHYNSQDNYFGVILLSGKYLLEQNNREVYLQPGDMTIYDATLPHRIYCPQNFSKLIISIPRKQMRERVAGVEHCTALKMKADIGIGAVTSSFIQSIAKEANQMTSNAFSAASDSALDLFTLALNNVRPQNIHLSRSRSLSLYRVKDFVARNLTNSALDSASIVAGTGLSERYINELFHDEELSLMRHVWKQRLANCYRDLSNPSFMSKQISEIALHWGFNDFSHFSRAFKQQYGVTPRSVKALN
ncbi:helix-turn-helix domain-containing protein [Methylotenera sp. L2L1]|uniref:AraC-like ligand-binding domain-containing protein n=1 Tax=Methylotenera sp. L2L1 TaxID=1502770 RepID=UPI000691BD74|nr:helix-turn-helix domain-containing protein [Methylotenera sp. L2L1]